MKTKITLTIAGVEHELPSYCLKNWDDIKCTYKRSDFSGVVRSFSSKFDFVKDAYDMLIDAWLETGIKTQASVAVWLMQSDWTFAKEFEAPLDFSSATWDGYTFSVNTIDNSLAASIKARKNTKYEFVIGEDIWPEDRLIYDRMVLRNSCSHEITATETDKNTGAVLLEACPNTDRLPVYSLNSETFEGSPIDFQDETTDDGSYFVSTIKSADNVKIRIEIWANEIGRYKRTDKLEIYLKQFDNGSETTLGKVFEYATEQITYASGKTARVCKQRTYVGTFRTFEELKAAYPNPPQNVWAMIGSGDSYDDVEHVYFTPVSNVPELVKWELGSYETIQDHRNSSIAYLGCRSVKYIMEFDYDALASGQKFALFYNLSFVDAFTSRTPVMPIYSKITTSWDSRGKALEILAISPKIMLGALADKMCDGRYNIIPRISDYDTKMTRTYLLAGESIRNLPDAKIYSTFNDYCNWMETVFGYTYYLGDPQPSKYVGVVTFYGSDDTAVSVTAGLCPALSDYEPIYCTQIGKFVVWCPDDGNYYAEWDGSVSFNFEGAARADMLFELTGVAGKCYCVEGSALVEYEGNPAKFNYPCQEIFFVHRSELFKNESQGIEITEANDITSKIDSSLLYASVDIGYDKQDYETECGRDEWNFTNHYNTGIDVNEKTLTLQSKYRADCYGLEFLAQKRSQDSTDDKSDSNIFFVHCKEQHTEEEFDDGSSRADGDPALYVTKTLVLDRYAGIDGTLTDTVFNGEFSAYFCVRANEGYIAAMADDVTLQFASSDGNSDIYIEHVKATANVPLYGRLFSAVEMSFVGRYLEGDVDYSKLISVTRNGMTYTGFLKETEVCYARPQEAKYTIIVKDIEKSW